jgi:hypothetical protein
VVGLLFVAIEVFPFYIFENWLIHLRSLGKISCYVAKSTARWHGVRFELYKKEKRTPRMSPPTRHFILTFFFFFFVKCIFLEMCCLWIFVRLFHSTSHPKEIDELSKKFFSLSEGASVSCLVARAEIIRLFSASLLLRACVCVCVVCVCVCVSLLTFSCCLSWDCTTSSPVSSVHFSICAFVVKTTSYFAGRREKRSSIYKGIRFVCACVYDVFLVCVCVCVCVAPPLFCVFLFCVFDFFRIR